MGTAVEENVIHGLVSLCDFEHEARNRLPKEAYDFFAGSANHGVSLAENRLAFSRLLLRGRCLRGIASVDLSTTVQGQRINFPVCVAPASFQQMAHPDGESENVRACSKAGTLFCLSMLSTSRMEDVAACSEGAPLWFQLYLCKDRQRTRHIVQQAEWNGHKALVLTIDTSRVGKRYDDERNRFCLPPHLTLPCLDLSMESERVSSASGEGSSLLASFFDKVVDLSISWRDVDWLHSITSLPIILKGVMTAEDARLAVEHGAAGVWVSNHGARQLDTTPAPIEVLPEVVAAVGGRCEVYVDGGFRSGTDVLKGLALGATAVFIGRPPVWGLACGGESGVRRVLDILKDELSLAMLLCGCAAVADISPALVIHRHRLHSQL